MTPIFTVGLSETIFEEYIRQTEFLYDICFMYKSADLTFFFAALDIIFMKKCGVVAVTGKNR